MKQKIKSKKKKSFHSLRTTLFLMCMGPQLLVFALGAGISLRIQKKSNSEVSQVNFNHEADRKAAEFNEYFDSTVRAVNVTAEYILNSIDENKIVSDPEYKKEYMESLEQVMSKFARTSKGAVSAYFRMELNAFGPEEGIFMVGTNKKGYKIVHPTDLSLYAPTDIKHVGWYYLPVWEEKAVWIPPYENSNINMYVFSYVMPIYKDSILLGVVGIDLNMATLKSLTSELSYENMSAMILTKTSDLIFYNSSQKFSQSVEAVVDLREMKSFLDNGKQSEIYEVMWDGQERYSMYRELSNGMKFVLLLPKSVLKNKEIITLVWFAVIFVVMAFFGFLIFRYGIIHIMKPVNELTEASYRLSRGEFGIPVNYHSNNELGILSHNIRKMASQLNEYIEYIREQAKREREAKEVAINASKAKSNFLANMSHEIRTPINAVLGMNEMILRETLRDDIRTYSLNIKNAGKALLALVNDVLDFSKIESGKIELVQDTYDLSSMLMDLISTISERIEKNGLEFKLNINKEIPSKLFGDSAKLKQCILNLLTNAVKYTQKGAVTFTVDYREIPYSDGKKIALQVKITDTGIGIKEEDLEKLFLPFERIEENRNRTVEGTGLGLNIVQRILEVMDSKLEVKSEYGSGSTFSFSVVQDVVALIPLGDIMKKYKEKVLSMEGYKETLFAPDARILFIDDTVMNLEVVKGLLKKTLIKIDAVLSGQEGLELVRQNEYDIIFIDHRMPIMDGLETLDSMKSMKDNKSAGKPCIALTANAISGAREMYLQAGFTDYLSKPVSPDKLEEMIREYLPAEKLRESLDGLGQSDEGSAAADALGMSTSDRGEQIKNPLPEVDGIDLNLARTYCGSDELMLKMFALFHSSAAKGADEIESLWKKGDLAAYRVKVHALKSSARTIGANKLSQMALALEMAAADSNMETINSDTPALLEQYKSLADSLLVYDSTAFSQEKSPEDSHAPFNEADVKKCLEDFKKACEDFDLDLLENTVGELQMHELPAAFVEDFKKIREFVRDVDFEGLAAFLKEL